MIDHPTLYDTRVRLGLRLMVGRVGTWYASAAACEVVLLSKCIHSSKQYIMKIKYVVYSGCEIEYFVETHLCKLCV